MLGPTSGQGISRVGGPLSRKDNSSWGPCACQMLCDMWRSSGCWTQKSPMGSGVAQSPQPPFKGD